MQIECGSQSTGDSSTADAEESVVGMEPASFFDKFLCVESLAQHVLNKEINTKLLIGVHCTIGYYIKSLIMILRQVVLQKIQTYTCMMYIHPCRHRHTYMYNCIYMYNVVHTHKQAHIYSGRSRGGQIW